MAKKLKGVDIFEIIERQLDKRDETSGKTYRELIAMQIVKTAAGQVGSARENMSAALAILDKLGKIPRARESEYLKHAHDKTKLITKYKIGDDEQEGTE